MASGGVLGGIDIGGSSVKVGLVRSTDGSVVERVHHAITDRDPNAIVELASAALEKLLSSIQNTLEGVGVGCPGKLLEGGVVQGAANFPSWKNVPLQQLFSERLNRKVVLCNDADAAILAERWVGTAKDNVKNFIMFTLGTGVGVGLIVDGSLVRGGSNTIEGGHMIVERNGRLCGCTQRGCLEAYSSAGALVTAAQEHMSAGADSKLASYAQEDVDAKLIFQLAAEGDQMCNRLIAEAADYLGFACVSFCRILDPQMIVLAGGLAEAGDVFIEDVIQSFNKYAWTKFSNPVKIEKASAGYDSGIIGAASAYKN